MNPLLTRIVIPLAAVMLLASCSKDKPASQLIGVWRFEEVTFRKGISLHKSDHTDVYSGICLHFFDDHTFLYHHAGRKLELTGYWEMDEEEQDTGESTITYTYLDWWAEDNHGNREEAKWNNINLRKDRLRVGESKNGGSYKYRLVKEY
jgi:hypothetical protein